MNLKQRKWKIKHSLSQSCKHKIILIFFPMLIAYAGLTGCQDPQPGPIIITTPTPAPTVEEVAQSQIDPTIESVLTLQSPRTATPQPSATPTVQTTPTCDPPENWVAYTIQANDTLSYLAAVTGVTIAEIKQANCILSDLLVMGDTLFLPQLPPVISFSGSSEIVVNVAEKPCSPFSCPDPELKGFPLPAGGGNDPVPCTEENTEPPWISAWPREIPPVYNIGDKVFFFACGFPESSQLTATLVGPQGSVFYDTLDFKYASSVPDYRGMGNWPYVAWYGVCNLSPEDDEDTYVLTVIDNHGNEAPPFEFKVQKARFETILTVPQFEKPGSDFFVYYCGYDPELTKDIKTDLFYATTRVPTNDGYDYFFEHSTSWTVKLNEDGWAFYPLTSLKTDPARSYWLQDRDENLFGEAQIWLTSP